MLKLIPPTGKSLHLVFTGQVVLPEWMEKISIDDFSIAGNMTKEEKANIKKVFLNIRIGIW